jgi:hypothetical protein
MSLARLESAQPWPDTILQRHFSLFLYKMAAEADMCVAAQPGMTGRSNLEEDV